MEVSNGTRETATSVNEAFKSWREDRKQRAMQLRQEACATYGVMAICDNAGSQEQWAETCHQAKQNLRSGRFLVEQLGAERHLAPELTATLLVLRQSLLEELGAETATDYLLVDIALLFHAQTLRAFRLIGDLALLVNDHFFLLETPLAKLEKRHGKDAFRGLVCEDYIQRIVEQLEPLMDRSNKGMLRNLRAVHEVRRSPSAKLSLGSIGQLNIAAELHVAQGTASADVSREDNGQITQAV